MFRALTCAALAAFATTAAVAADYKDNPVAKALYDFIEKDALPGTAPLPVDIAIEGVPVCARGAVVPHDAAALVTAVARDEVEYEIGLPGEGVETEVFFSDLGHEYVTINADYTT